MKGNHKDLNFILDRAIAAVREDHADPQVEQVATTNAWQRISQSVGVDATIAPLNRIEGCADVQALLADFQAHRLAPARAMLVADHLRECAACRVHAKVDKSAESILPWRAESVLRPRHWSFGQYALAASLVIAAVLGITIGRNGVLAPSGYRASLESVDGTIYRVDARGEHRASVGEQFGEGEMVRTASGSRAMLRLRDGSHVELNGRSELYVSLGWRNTTVHLDRGIVIVQAAKRSSGHLYVKTPDARVAVTGTIFSVNSGIKGSRVSVIEGTVHVAEAGGEAVLHAGDQATTTASMGEVPVRDEIAWSQDRDKYLALLAQFAILQKKLENIPLPGLRTDSRLLKVVPDGSVVYVGIPNYGEALAQANELLQQQISQSELLREWWQQQGPGKAQNGNDFSQVIETIHNFSQYIGNEIVFTASGGQEQHGNVLAVAEVVPGAASEMREFLERQIQRNQGADHLHIVTPTSLYATPQADGRDMYVLITHDFVAASPFISSLSEVNGRWSRTAGSSGFAQSDFGKRIAAEYNTGAGLLVAINIGQIAQKHVLSAQADRREGLLESSGFANAKYLIAERKDVGNQTSNTAELSFSGPRTGIASWLATPAPIGALDFITPNAAAVGAFVSKSPALMVDDLLQIASAGNARASDSFAKEESELNLDIRNDLAASLGGEAALALDGPILPTPSWKLVVEVNDPSRLQYSIGKLVDAINREAAQHNRPPLKLDEQDVNGSPFYTVFSPTVPVPMEVHYTFFKWYLVAGPTQAIVQDAIQTSLKPDGGISQSDKFKALLPPDPHMNVSGLIYQNLAPTISSITGQVSAAQLQSLRTIVANSEPSLICAYADDDEHRIELSSTSKTLGIDLKALTISALLHQLKSGTAQPVTP